MDLNPLAVDLCKVALWLEGLNRNMPLTFLDHRIKCGNSLVGLDSLDRLHEGVPEGAFKPATGDAKEAARAFHKTNKKELKDSKQVRLDLFLQERFTSHAKTFAEGLKGVAVIADDQAAAVYRKQELYRGVVHSPEWETDQTAANIWTAAFFWPLTDPRDRGVPTTNRLMDFLESPDAAPDVAAKADEIAKEHRFFHWPLQFPEVFEKRGFDLVIGNPPWERIKLQEQEFFAVRDPDIAKAPNKAAREAMIAELAQRNPRLLKAFEKAKHDAEDASLFVRASGRFPLTAVGDVNTYALFAELAVRLTNDAGRAAVIVPTGIATDDTCKRFFADLNEKRRLVSLFDFENKEALFPGVHRSYKFCLLTTSAKPTAATQFAFFLTRTEHLDDKIRRFTLSADDLALINPNTRTAPVFRTKIDAELTKKIYQRVPVLVNEKTGENPWGIRFVRLFDMSNDSGLFRTAAQLDADGFVREGPNFVSDRGVYVPLYEAKMIWQFDHRYGTFEGFAERPSSQTKTPTVDQYRDANYTVTPWYWVPKDEVENRLARWGWNRKWLIGYRRITHVTNERTMIASVVPPVAQNDGVALFIITAAARGRAFLLLANLNSLILDYVTRQKIGGVHLDFFPLRQLPVIAPTTYRQNREEFFRSRVLELVYTSCDLQPFARDCGYDGPPFRWDEERRALLRAELDAYYAYLYGLNRDELLYILDPQEVYGAEFPGETFRVLKDKEMSRHGEYRTKRLVMEAWDRLFGKEAHS